MLQTRLLFQSRASFQLVPMQEVCPQRAQEGASASGQVPRQPWQNLGWKSALPSGGRQGIPVCDLEVEPAPPSHLAVHCLRHEARSGSPPRAHRRPERAPLRPCTSACYSLCRPRHVRSTASRMLRAPRKFAALVSPMRGMVRRLKGLPLLARLPSHVLPLEAFVSVFSRFTTKTMITRMQKS